MNAIVEVQTRTGRARFTLVKDQLLVMFYMGETNTGSVQLKLIDPEVFYRDGAWNLTLLAWVVNNHEPKFKRSSD